MFLTVSAVAKILNTSEGNVRALERKGTLRATRTSSGERLFKPKDVDRAKQLRAKVQGRDVRATANVRPAVNEPDWLADSIAAQFSASRLDAIRAFYKHRPRGDAWFLVEIVDDTLAALKSLRALIHDLGVQDADDSWNEAIARADAVIARAEGK